MCKRGFHKLSTIQEDKCCQIIIFLGFLRYKYLKSIWTPEQELPDVQKRGYNVPIKRRVPTKRTTQKKFTKN